MRTLAIFKRIMLQRRGDPRTLAMMFLAPIFILTLIVLSLSSAVKYCLQSGFEV